ncbi:MAG TPA: cohesin domain-containing protein [Armatimonadota bacterium]|jgi:hypothetical protein
MTARFTITAIALACLLLLPAARALAETKNLSIENEFIRLVVNRGPNEAGRFSIETTGGDPTRPASKNQQLIYGGNTPWTSFTTVRIDDTNYVFGGATERRAGLGAKYGTLLSGPTVKDNAIDTAYQFDDIVVTQELSFERGASSRMLDTVGISYRIENTGKAAHQVGLRMLLDTKLGANDGAPFRAGLQSIKSATMLLGQDLPDYWQAFDTLDPIKMTVISQGTLKGAGISRPDKVIFADWGTLADDVWEPTLDANQGFVRKGEDEDDTASALYWQATTLDPGKSASYTTNYGIGYINVAPGVLRVGISAPAESTFEYERTQPITIAGYLTNTGAFEGRNVTLTLKLPEGLRLDSGSKAVQTITSFKPGDELQSSWLIVPNGKGSGKLTIKLEATSDNLEPNKEPATCDIQVNVPKPKLVLSPNMQRVIPVTTKRATKVPIMVNLSPAVDFYAVRFTLTYNPTVMQPLIIARGSALVEDGRLLSGWDYDESQDGKIIITASRDNAQKLTQANINLAVITFNVTGAGACPLTLTDAVLVNEKGETSPVATSAGNVEVNAEALKP